MGPTAARIIQARALQALAIGIPNFAMNLHYALISVASVGFAMGSPDERVFDRKFEGAEDWNFHFHTDFDSRYATEGRDSLDGDGLASATFEAAWNAFSAGVWYGGSPGQRYDELQISAAANWEWKDLEGYFAYTHLRFPSDDAHDNEIGAGIVWSGLPLDLQWGADAYHSFDAEGVFIETYLGRELVISDRFRITPAIVFGVNQGYVADGHDGANHLAPRLDAEFSLTDSITLAAHASYSFGIDADAASHPGDDLLGDFFHAGFGLRWEF
jgi:hypothetical protein